MVEFIDAHCHLDDPRFDADRQAVLSRARQAGVRAQVVAGVSRTEWPRLRAITQAEPDLSACYGLHPMFLAAHQQDDLDALASWLRAEPCVAVGECGLDGYEPEPDWAAQTVYFRAQLELAAELDLPVVLHARRAVDQVLKQLRLFPGLSGMVHSFAGSQQQAQQLLDRGFYLSLGGPVTHARAKRLRQVATYIPSDRLLVETDAPDQPGAAHRGERNEPAFLTEVVEVLAELRGDTPAAIATATAANARRLLKIPSPPV
mgnify:CR=1 FL=1